jgi:NADH-quinone oxidoreductase subunit C
MDADALVAALQETLPGVPLELAPSIDLQTTIRVAPGDVLAVAQALRDRPALAFAFLAEVTAVDRWPRAPRFELVYHLVSIEHALRVRLKVQLEDNAARVATLSGLWPAANWLEREVWDLFGIEFENHPDPRRLLMPEDWEGFPLRKDFPVQINQHVQSSSPMQVTEEEFRANLQKDRLSRG